jgi:hypothetical protein
MCCNLSGPAGACGDSETGLRSRKERPWCPADEPFFRHAVLSVAYSARQNTEEVTLVTLTQATARPTLNPLGRGLEVVRADLCSYLVLNLLYYGLVLLRIVSPAGVSWTKPAGGLFVWLRLPAGADSRAMLQLALKENLAFVPGARTQPTTRFCA